MSARSFAALADFTRVAQEYRGLRIAHPTVPAAVVHSYVRYIPACSFEQFVCEQDTGHEWATSDETRVGDEGRSYCLLCGADGDA